MTKNKINKNKESNDDLALMKKKLSVAKREISRFKGLVFKDSLTRLYNRKGFLSEVVKFVKSIKGVYTSDYSRRAKRSFFISNITILFIDVNDFKAINDKYGHDVGDLILKKIANILKEAVRDMDIVARWGGDEFIVALIGESGEGALQGSLKRIHAMCDLARAKNKKHPIPYLSIGSASIYEKKRNPKLLLYIDDVINLADKRMYENKRDSKLKNRTKI